VGVGAVPFVRPLRAGDTGPDVEGVGRALCRAGFYVPLRVFQALPVRARRRAHRSFVRAVKRLQRAEGWPADGIYGQAEHQVLADAGAFDQRALTLLRMYRPQKWTEIGAVQPGGPSLLDHQLTHETSGIPLFPAFDTAWGAGGGVACIAPEDCVVDTKDTSSRPGEAVFLNGASGLRYWVGHLDRDWPLGTRLRKGDLIGRTLAIPGASDHAHWGVNAEALLGRGKQLAYGATGKGPPYTYGSPTIREQLRRVCT
jgi:hypothetical protein